jgi:hypothetical protein
LTIKLLKLNKEYNYHKKLLDCLEINILEINNNIKIIQVKLIAIQSKIFNSYLSLKKLINLNEIFIKNSHKHRNLLKIIVFNKIIHKNI